MNYIYYDVKKGERIEKRIIIIKKILEAYWSSNYDTKYHKKDFDEMNSTIPRKVINGDRCVPHSLQRGDSVSVTFGSKCGPLQSSLVIFSVLFDLSSRNLFDGTDSVIQCAFNVFFSFLLSILSLHKLQWEEKRERKKKEEVLKTQQSFDYENINTIKKSWRDKINDQ